MASTYRLWITPEEDLEVQAKRFDIKGDGVLVFYEEPNLPEGATLADIEEEYPFAAYNEWHSIIRVD